MPQFIQRDLTQQYISNSYQDVVQRYTTTGSTTYLLDGIGYVIFGIPTSSIGEMVLTQDQTASFALTSSYAFTSSVELQHEVSTSWASESYHSTTSDISITSSYAVFSELSDTSSLSILSEFANTASLADNSITSISASFSSQSLFATSASWVPFIDDPNALSASWASSSFIAISSSFASQSLSASWSPIPSSASWSSQSLWATSASYASSSISSSYSITSSFSVTSSYEFLSIISITSSYASQSSYAISASWASESISSSRSISASYSPWSDFSLSSSWSSQSLSSSFAISASWAPGESGGSAESASWASSSLSASYALSASWAPSPSPIIYTSSFALTDGIQFNTSFPHGLSSTPTILRAVLLCTNTDTSSSLTIGQEIETNYIIDQTNGCSPAGAKTDGSNVYAYYSGISGSNCLLTSNTSTNSVPISSFSNFSLKVYYGVGLSGVSASLFGSSIIITSDNYYMGSSPETTKYFFYQPPTDDPYSWNTYLPDLNGTQSFSGKEFHVFISIPHTQINNPTIYQLTVNTPDGKHRIISTQKSHKANSIVLINGMSIMFYGIFNPTYNQWEWVTHESPLVNHYAT